MDDKTLESLYQLEEKILKIRKRILTVAGGNPNQTLSEAVDWLLAVNDLLREKLAKERQQHEETKATLQKWENMTAEELGEMIAGM